jgi:hypothetical protein
MWCNNRHCSIPDPTAGSFTAASAPFCCRVFLDRNGLCHLCGFLFECWLLHAIAKSHTARFSHELCPLQDFLAERLLLDAIMTVVDAKHIEQHLDDEKPEGVENEVCLRHPCEPVNKKVEREISCTTDIPGVRAR